MKTCLAQLVHTVYLNFKTGMHVQRVRVTIVLEGRQDLIDIIKWQFSSIEEHKLPLEIKY